MNTSASGYKAHRSHPPMMNDARKRACMSRQHTTETHRGLQTLLTAIEQLHTLSNNIGLNNRSEASAICCVFSDSHSAMDKGSSKSEVEGHDCTEGVAPMKSVRCCLPSTGCRASTRQWTEAIHRRLTCTASLLGNSMAHTCTIGDQALDSNSMKVSTTIHRRGTRSPRAVEYWYGVTGFSMLRRNFTVWSEREVSEGSLIKSFTILLKSEVEQRIQHQFSSSRQEAFA